MGEALHVLTFEHQTRAAFARLVADPAGMQSYAGEAALLADVDVDVQD